MRLKDTPKGANLVFLLTVLANICVSFLYEFLLIFGIDIFAGSLVIQLVSSQVIFILPMVLYLICTKTKGTIFRFKKIDILTILLCLVFYICISQVLTFLNMVSMLYSTNMIQNVMIGISDEVPFVIGLLAIALIPAFCEEITYRGFFYNTYRKEYPLGAILLCGLLFGLMHGNLNQFTYAFALGMVFAILVEATDSIWSSVTVHMLVNAFSVIIIYVLPWSLGILEGLYNTAVAENDTMTMNLVENLLGTTDFSADAILGGAQQLSKADILSAMGGYAIAAVIGGALAFLVLRLIAKRCGRWEIICAIFSKKRRAAMQQPAQTIQPVQLDIISEEKNIAQPGTVAPAPVSTPEVPLVPAKNKLITWEFIVGAVIMVGQMVLYELLMAVA